MEDKALRYIAGAADGSMRDGLSLLDQCNAFNYGNEVLTYEKTLEILGAVDTRVFSRLYNHIHSGDTAAALKVDPLEEVVDFLCDELKKHHIDRVSRQECTLENGFVFNDLLTDYERIADHCDNIAMDVIESGSR